MIDILIVGEEKNESKEKIYSQCVCFRRIASNHAFFICSVFFLRSIHPSLLLCAVISRSELNYICVERMRSCELIQFSVLSLGMC